MSNEYIDGTTRIGTHSTKVPAHDYYRLRKTALRGTRAGVFTRLIGALYKVKGIILLDKYAAIDNPKY